MNKNKTTHGWFLTNSALESKFPIPIPLKNRIGTDEYTNKTPTLCIEGFHGCKNIINTFEYRDHECTVMAYCKFTGPFNKEFNNPKYTENKFCSSKRKIKFAIDISNFVFVKRKGNITIKHKLYDIHKFLNNPYYVNGKIRTSHIIPYIANFRNKYKDKHKYIKNVYLLKLKTYKLENSLIKKLSEEIKSQLLTYIKKETGNIK